MKKKLMILIPILVIIIIIVNYLYNINVIPHKKYSNEYFKIETYHSSVDKDNDGVDDQTDILKSAREYLKSKPKYLSKYYATGYPDDEHGVCTDVVAYALKGAGYDLQQLVNEDVINNRKLYNIDIVDKNIDFRRVQNLKVYFKRNAIELTTDLSKKEEWQGGDIVIFPKHIGIVSDNRNKKGIPFLIHHNKSSEKHNYEEDVLSNYKILGHYRIS